MPALPIRTDITPAELRRRAREERDGRVAARLIGIANALEGMRRDEAARLAGMDRQTLRDWVIRYNQQGVEGLNNRTAPGRQSDLTEGQQAALKAIILAGPDPKRDQVRRWRMVDLIDLVEAKWGVRYSETGMLRLVWSLDLSHQQPRPEHPKADRRAQERFKKEAMGRATTRVKHHRCANIDGEPHGQAIYDLSKPLVALDHDSTLVAVIEMSGASWLVAAVVPGVERRPLQKLPVDEGRLLAQLERWRAEAAAAGKPVARVVVGFEAGRDGLWLARWLRARGVEAHPIHPSSVAVSREARRAKTDRLDTAMLMRGLLGWLRGEPDHCRIVAVPTAAEEDARRPGREREHLVGERTRVVNRLKANLARLGIRGFNPKLRKAAARLAELRTPEGEPIPPRARAEMERDLERLDLIRRQVEAIERAREEALAREPEGPNAMVLMLAKVRGVGIETADMLVREVLSRGLRDRRALARLAGLTGTPDESGAKRRQKGIAKAGVARVRRGLIQLAWRLLQFQRESALVRWYEARTAGARGAARKTFLVALARKLLLALARYATHGELPEGFVLNPA